MHPGISPAARLPGTAESAGCSYLAFYAVWPKAMSAMAVAKQVFRADID